MSDELFKKKYRIPSNRLPGWDYSKNGYYFVTICVKNRACAFGAIESDEMVLSDIGKAAEQCWREIPEHFPFVQLDEFIIMPNHLHGIIVIDKDDNIVETHNHASLPKHNKFGPQSKNRQLYEDSKSVKAAWASLAKPEDTKLKRDVAIKFLPRQIATIHNIEDDEMFHCHGIDRGKNCGKS